MVFFSVSLKGLRFLLNHFFFENISMLPIFCLYVFQSAPSSVGEMGAQSSKTFLRASRSRLSIVSLYFRFTTALLHENRAEVLTPAVCGLRFFG